jgi:hypothetical protein
MLHTLAGNGALCWCNFVACATKIVLAECIEWKCCFRYFHPQEEGIDTIEALSSKAARKFATLLCFVLVSPAGGHAFTSAYDFGPWPLLAGVADLQPCVLKVGICSFKHDERYAAPGCRGSKEPRVSNLKSRATIPAHLPLPDVAPCGIVAYIVMTVPANGMQVLRNTRALMLNGFVLDELPGPLVVAAARQTRAAGGSVFFDPGAGPVVCSCADVDGAAPVRNRSFLCRCSQMPCQRQCASHATLQASAAKLS